MAKNRIIGKSLTDLISEGWFGDDTIDMIDEEYIEEYILNIKSYHEDFSQEEIEALRILAKNI